MVLFYRTRLRDDSRLGFFSKDFYLEYPRFYNPSKLGQSDFIALIRAPSADVPTQFLAISRLIQELRLDNHSPRQRSWFHTLRRLVPTFFLTNRFVALSPTVVSSSVPDQTGHADNLWTSIRWLEQCQKFMTARCWILHFFVPDTGESVAVTCKKKGLFLQSFSLLRANVTLIFIGR